jgi:hypothetical protein
LQDDLTNTWMAEIAPSHLLHLAWCTEPGKFATSPQNIDWLDRSIRLFHHSDSSRYPLWNGQADRGQLSGGA